jgi:outer membrane protein assembly factor BamD
MRHPSLSIALALPLILGSCGSNKLPPVGQAGSNNPKADAIYQKAQQAEQSGKTKKAIKLYDELADDYPLVPQAPQARYKQARLLEQRGETVKAFEAYQDFITRYRGSNLYEKALSSQARMAQGAADGEIKTSFLGLKSNLPTDKVVGMLEKVRDNAPAAPSASKAQFSIGALHQGKNHPSKAIDAYRELVYKFPDSKEAPEGQFRIGVILNQEAKDGNQDKANLDLAREAFKDYLLRYPGHSKNAEARRLVAQLGGQDIQRSFDVAEFYLKKGNTESAKLYYREVLGKAKSGPLHDKAKARLAELGE